MNTSLKPMGHSGRMPSCEAAVECITVNCGALPAVAEVARFRGSSGTIEYHITVRLTGACAIPAGVLDLAYRTAMDAVRLDPSSMVFRRVFCSDATNQAGIFIHPPGSSMIGQTPLPAAKFALWAYHICDSGKPLRKEWNGITMSCKRSGLTHHWTTSLISTRENNSHDQTRTILENYGAWLGSLGMNTADHVVRTWWFVRNIDADYQGLVDARRDHFERHGLTADTHYIASTGIEGAHRDVAAMVSLDSYAIQGLIQEQLEHLCAPDHLCPTHDYGVTFERGTTVSYADRRHVFISGTASIDHTGRILHEGDVNRQLDRTLENIEALLAKSGANLGDLAVALVYLRDPADADAIQAALLEKLAGIPSIILRAPVCRPGWLIEIEAIAIVSCHTDLPAF